MLQEDGSFLIRGDADLQDVDAILGLSLAEESALKDFATLSGFLCMCAGEIPNSGDLIMSRGWCFEIENADDKKVLLAKVERLISEDDTGDEDTPNNPIRTLLKLNNNKDSSDDTTDDDDDESKKRSTEQMIRENIQQSHEANIAEAKEIERIVESGQRKIEFLREQENESLSSSSK